MLANCEGWMMRMKGSFQAKSASSRTAATVKDIGHRPVAVILPPIQIATISAIARETLATGTPHSPLNADVRRPPRRMAMKKFIIAAVAASVLAAPTLAAPYQGNDGRGRYEQNHRAPVVTHRTVVTHKTVIRHDVRKPDYRKWSKGQRFDHRYASNYRVISSPRAYRLQPAPRGYHWVQSGNDAVLVGITSGIVASVLANMIR
jgi:Ni/Co efflux regulator RcnB